MTAGPSPTARLAEFLGSAPRRALPADVTEKAATCLLDAFGLALAARDEPTVTAYSSIPQPVSTTAGCRLWGGRAAVSVLDGVAGNALATHARFQDDCDMTSWAHPGSLIVPVAVGLGEMTNRDLAAVLAAIAHGYATLNWLGADEVVGRAVVEHGFRASPTLGSVAAAATAAVVLGLSAEQARSAVGIATDSTGGLLEPVRSGASDWRVQNATAAYRGALAGLLAARGVDGSPAALEGPAGLLRAVAGTDAPPDAWSHDPQLRSILTVWAKPYPTLGDNMAVVATALVLRDRIGEPRTVARVLVHQNAHFASYPGTAYRGPFTTPTRALASTAFATAATLLYGPLRYEVYRTRLDDPQIAAMVDRVRIVPEADFGYLDAAVEVQLGDGSTVRASSSDLPRNLFFRDRPVAAQAFRALLDEAGFPPSFAASTPNLIFDHLKGGGPSIAAVVDTLAETEPTSPGGRHG